MSNKETVMAAIEVKEDITIDLCTRPADRIWNGREKTDNKHGIMGIPGFCKFLKTMESAIREDDPYADYYYHKIEQSIEDLEFDLSSELKDIQTIIESNVPSAMKLPETGSKSPTVYPVRVASRLGFRMVYQVLKLDQVVLKVLLANHIGVLSTKDKFQTLDRIERKLRGVIYQVFDYKHMSVTRDDLASNNQRAQNAKKQMGDLEVGYIEGTLRSEHAPPLPPKRLSSLNEELDTGKAQAKSKAKKKTPVKIINKTKLSDSKIDKPIAKKVKSSKVKSDEASLDDAIDSIIGEVSTA